MRSRQTADIALMVRREHAHLTGRRSLPRCHRHCSLQ
jgi:hypothetical protein